jgi:hypothetical protein
MHAALPCGNDRSVMDRPLMMISAVTLDAACALRDPQYALDPARNAAGHPAHCASHGATYRTGCPIADRGALLSASHDALGVREARRSEKSETGSRHQEMDFHSIVPYRPSASTFTAWGKFPHSAG